MGMAVVVTAAGALAGAAPAAAAEYGKWRVAVTTSLKHEWTLRSDQACAPTGPGAVTLNAKARTKPFRMAYRVDGRDRRWEIFPRPFRASGTIARTDRTTQNPPASGDECAPTRKSGCESRPLHRRTQGSVEGMNTRGRRPGVTFSLYGVMDAFTGRGRCQTGRFRDFNNYPGAPFANYGRMAGRMPRPGRVKRKPFTVKIVERRSAKRSWGRTETVRRAKLRFIPV